MSREAMKLALDALEDIFGKHKVDVGAINALRAALDAYDQTALELCETCGWKAVIPDDGCLVCARQKPVLWYHPLSGRVRFEETPKWIPLFK